LNLDSPQKPARFGIYPLDSHEEQLVDEVEIPAGWSGWGEIKIEDPRLANGFRLQVLDAESPVWVRGIQLDPRSSLCWPWDQGVEMDYASAKTGATHSAVFSSENAFSGLDRELEILHDCGSTVLWKVR
jgi:hypothetical protein